MVLPVPSVPTPYSWPTCPRCRQKLAAIPACPGCGLTLGQLDEVYGSGEVVLERVTDAQGVFGEAGKRWLEQAVAGFESSFPQAMVAVHVGALGSGPALRQFGFWLLNRSVLTAGEITRPNENGMLLLIDPPARLAGLTLGYQLEPWLSESVLERVLSAGRRDFQAGRMAEGGVRIIRALGMALRDSLRGPMPLADEAVPTAPLLGLRRLRRGGKSESTSHTPGHHEV